MMIVQLFSSSFECRLTTNESRLRGYFAQKLLQYNLTILNLIHIIIIDLSYEKWKEQKL